MKEYRRDMLTVKDITYMVDPSVLKLDASIKDMETIVEACKKYDFGSCFYWPCYYPQLVGMLEGTSTTFRTSLAFPSGRETTETKVYLAHEFMKFGPAENDMVMNVGYLGAGQYDLVLEDIKTVREATKGTLLKVITKAVVLTDDGIRKACELAIEGGADCVKLDIRFSEGPTALHHVEVTKEAVGDHAKVKVADGVRDLDTMLKMCKRGTCRFGVDFTSALKIVEKAIAVGHDIDMSIID